MYGRRHEYPGFSLRRRERRGRGAGETVSVGVYAGEGVEGEREAEECRRKHHLTKRGGLVGSDAKRGIDASDAILVGPPEKLNEERVDKKGGFRSTL